MAGRGLPVRLNTSRVDLLARRIVAQRQSAVHLQVLAGHEAFVAGQPHRGRVPEGV